MATIRKFLFDTSFDAEPEPEPEEVPSVPPPPPITEADVAAARAEGFAAGHAEGEQSVRARAERDQAMALNLTAERLESFAEAVTSVLPAAETRATEIGMAVARKLLPELLRREGAAEVEALVRDCLRDMFDEPRIVLRVGDTLLDPINERLPALAGRSGFAGRIILLAEEGLTAGDCRIEWADGGVERSAARMWREIEAAVGRCLETNTMQPEGAAG